MKIKEPQFKIGEIVRVVCPTQAVNFSLNQETKKFDIEDIILVGDESMIISEVEYIKKSKEHLYKCIMAEDNVRFQREFSLSEEQICYWEEDINEKV